MLDIEKQIVFWKDSAREDFAVARQLVNSGRTRHGLFFAHLALEKSLKAIVCKHTQDLAPRLHNLVRLYEFAALPLSDTVKTAILAEMNAFNIEGRYPEPQIRPPTKEEALHYMSQVEGIFEWLMNQS